MFDSWKGFCENIRNLFSAGDVFDVESPFFEVISKEVISNIDVLGSLIFWLAFCDGFGSFIVCVEDRDWQFD